MAPHTSAEETPFGFTPTLLRLNLFRPLPIVLGGICIRRLFHRLDDGITRSGRDVSRIHLRQRAHGGESHIDNALDPFPEGLAGALYRLGRNKFR